MRGERDRDGFSREKRYGVKEATALWLDACDFGAEPLAGYAEPGDKAVWKERILAVGVARALHKALNAYGAEAQGFPFRSRRTTAARPRARIDRTRIDAHARDAGLERRAGIIVRDAAVDQVEDWPVRRTDGLAGTAGARRAAAAVGDTAARVAVKAADAPVVADARIFGAGDVAALGLGDLRVRLRSQADRCQQGSRSCDEGTPNCASCDRSRKVVESIHIRVL